MLFVGMEILHKRFVLLVFTAAHTPLTADLVAFLVVHVYATAHLTKIGVLEFCLGGPASELGLGGKTVRFLAWRTRVLGKEFATDRGRLVSRQKMSVFLPR